MSGFTLLYVGFGLIIAGVAFVSLISVTGPSKRGIPDRASRIALPK